MKARVKKRGLTEANRALAGILSAAIVMSNLSGTGLVVHAAETEMPVEKGIGTEITEQESVSVAEETAFDMTTASEEEIQTQEVISVF